MILPIILGILRIILILAGLLLGLFLLLLLIVLLVPVRYQARAVKEGETLEGTIALSWLAHAVSVKAKAGKEIPLKLELFLFGFRIPLPGKKKAGDSQKKKEKKSGRLKRRKKQSVRQPSGESAQNRQLPVKTQEKEPSAEKAAAKEQPGQERRKEPDSKEPKPKETDSKEPKPKETDSKEPKPKEPDSKEPKPKEPDSQDTSGRSSTELPGRITEKLKHLSDSLQNQYHSVQERIKRGKDVFAGIRRKLEKPEEIRRILSEAGWIDIIKDVFSELQYLYRHWGIRFIRGYLKFGTGDPAVTGQLTGLCYVLLPSKADQFTLIPNFEVSQLETSVQTGGRIRSVHLILVLWHLWRDKRLFNLIKKLR